jgi:hypothetical protein
MLTAVRYPHPKFNTVRVYPVTLEAFQHAIDGIQVEGLQALGDNQSARLSAVMN